MNHDERATRRHGAYPWRWAIGLGAWLYGKWDGGAIWLLSFAWREEEIAAGRLPPRRSGGCRHCWDYTLAARETCGRCGAVWP